MSQGSKSSKPEQVEQNFLKELTDEVLGLISKDYYNARFSIKHKPISLKEAIKSNKPALITELKFSSPSLGEIRVNDQGKDVDSIVSQMERGGATGISVLTQPLYFEGSLENLKLARIGSRLPLLMKDIIVDERQIEAGRSLGADAILLIERLFSKDGFESLDYLIDFAHKKEMEVLLEVNSAEEFERAAATNADILGINNRDLATLELNLKTTERILSRGIRTDKPIMSESGIESRDEINMISSLGVSAFLVGTSIMRSENVEAKVLELKRGG